MKPMLAERKLPDTSGIAYPIYASPKLDGIRALVIDGQLRSRALKPFPNAFVQKSFSSSKYSGLDGELIFGEPSAPDVYRETQKVVSRRAGEPNVKFYLFDLWDAKLPYASRYDSVKEAVIGRRLPCVELVPSVIVTNELQLLDYERQQLDLGYEGLILRSPNGPYKFGRSTMKEGWMLKLKRFEDAEATVVEVYEEMHNGNEAKTNELGRTKRSSHQANLVGKERAGGFVCASPDFPGVTFDVPSTTIPHDERPALWRKRKSVVGKVLKYKYFAHGGKDRPRHPVFLGWRDKWDL